MIVLKIKKLIADSKTPAFAHQSDAGMDLYAAEETVILPGERKAVRTGIALEIPEGYVGLIWDKSGLSMKHGLRTLGGVIDAPYRGEVLIGIINLSKEPYTFEKNHKVAQLVIQKVEHPEVRIVDELSETDRGTQGFGSSGK